jgi:hypothetical protein
MALAQPQVPETFQKLIEAGKNLQKRNAIMAKSMDSGAAHGFLLWNGVYRWAVFSSEIPSSGLMGTPGMLDNYPRALTRPCARVDGIRLISSSTVQTPSL